MNDHALKVIRECPKHSILIGETGSRAYGIHNNDSDYDFAGVYVIPLRRYLSYQGHGADTIVRHKEPDATFHDIGKFCRLAAQGNPNVLEVLWGPIRYKTGAGMALLDIREAFLHRGSLKPFFGYYTAQRRRLESGFSVHTKGGEWNPKFAAHLLRLLYAAAHLAMTGEVLVELKGEAKEVVLSARSGEMTIEDVLRKADDLEAAAHEAEAGTSLPYLPDKGKIDLLVYDIRTGVIT